MNVGTQPAPTQATPISNMRITLWGVQGSCPIFPAPEGVREYSRRLAVQTLERVIQEIQARGGSVTASDLLGGEPTRENIERFQHRLGQPDLRIFGGETTSLEIETSEGNIILLDAGSGIRRCSFEIVRRWQDRPDPAIHLFASHEHLDHRVGLTFARFLYTPTPYRVHVYGPQRFLFALDQHYGMMSRKTSTSTYLDDPVDYTMITAKFAATEFIRPGEALTAPRPWPVVEMAPIRIGSTTVTPFEVYHPVPMCLGYRIEHNGRSFVYATDHELRHGTDKADPRQQRSDAAEATLRRHCQDADLAYFDGQYSLDEYAGRKGIGAFPAMPRLDWGHGCIEDIVERAETCRIRQTYIGHHDPERSWAERVEMDGRLAAMCQGKPFQVHLADGDAVIDL